jgi:predicted RNA-binding protein
MCLATVYKNTDDSIILRNVSKIELDGDKIIFRDILGDEKTVSGKLLMADLANGVVKVACD